MQAIITKYIGATNYRPSRIKATCEAGSVTIAYPYEDEEEESHAQAARALVDKLGWTEANGYPAMVCGGLPQSIGGYVFVFLPRAKG